MLIWFDLPRHVNVYSSNIFLLVTYLTWQSQLQEKYAAALDAESKDASKAADTQHIVAQLQHKVCLCVCVVFAFRM